MYVSSLITTCPCVSVCFEILTCASRWNDQWFGDRSARFEKFIFLEHTGNKQNTIVMVVEFFVSLVRLTVRSGYTIVSIHGSDDFECLDDRCLQEKQLYVHFLCTSCPNIYTIFSHRNVFSVILDRVAHNVCAAPLFESRRCDLDRKRTTC